MVKFLRLARWYSWRVESHKIPNIVWLSMNFLIIMLFLMFKGYIHFLTDMVYGQWSRTVSVSWLNHFGTCQQLNYFKYYIYWNAALPAKHQIKWCKSSGWLYTSVISHTYSYHVVFPCSLVIFNTGGKHI